MRLVPISARAGIQFRELHHRQMKLLLSVARTSLLRGDNISSSSFIYILCPGIKLLENITYTCRGKKDKNSALKKDAACRSMEAAHTPRLGPRSLVLDRIDLDGVLGDQTHHDLHGWCSWRGEDVHTSSSLRIAEHHDVRPGYSDASAPGVRR